ncbi:efflux RND transporter permease subunit [Opitutus terrae]|uniref:Acriflavin resistance protein n=1 Tax=Opitutus terrae (strain DSM 11246 / JCM 15787 / PB90-1) TaxID=452637 RepID=B1ZWU0_OPITP|nr:efflux RND transporter permease subunit [Opitutus terrae]ACB74217.1 acriflavin resistance protein [Opitutus terrae PB90-1]
MRFTDLFIRRPVLATVVNLFLLIIGGLAIKSMVIRQYPQTNNAVIRVTTTYPGASADLIRGFITTPLEREIASADGLDYVESVSAPNVSIITAKLRLNYDPNDALTQITSKVNRARRELPVDAEDPVFDVSVGESTASMYLTFSSAVLGANQVTDYLTRVVQPKLSTVEGVQKAEIMGARTFAMRIWLDPEKMAAFGLSASQVWAKLSTQNHLSAVGKTKGSMVSVNLTAGTDLQSAGEFRQMVIRENKGEIVRLGDIANVVLGAESYDVDVKFAGQETTIIAISVLPTANSIDVIKGVRAVWPEVVSQLPAGLDAGIAYDATEFINDSITEVMETLLEAMLIVVLVIYAFLGSFRSVVIPIVAIPLSLVGVCALMLSLGFSINLLTLLAMVLAIGLVVDDAIVVVENIHRHIEEGLSPLDAALKGAHELVGPIIAMTITLAAVYAPIGLQSGVTGALFREFAFTLAGAVIVSGFVALTLSPMLSSKLLRHNPNPRGIEHFLDVAFTKLRDRYEHLLDQVLNTRPAVYLVAVLIVAAIMPFYALTKKELAPPEDRGFIVTISQGSPNGTLDQALRYSERFNELLKQIPEVNTFFSIAGFDMVSGMASPSSGLTGVSLVPWSQREASAADLIPQILGRASTIAGVNYAAFLPPSLPGAGGGLPVQFVVSSTANHDRVAVVTQTLLQRALASGNFLYGDTDLKFDQPQADVKIDRDKAALLGIDMKQLGTDLGAMLGGGQVNRFAIQGRAYRVIPQVTRSARLTPDQLADYYISTGKGELVPLSSVAEIVPTTQPRDLRRFQQLNCATISLLPRPGLSMGEALDWLNAEAKTVFPEGFASEYKGESRQFVQEGSSLMATFVLAIVVIFLVLAAQYESFRDPFIIMMAVPLSIAGAMVFLFLGVATLNIYTQVGLITLVGLITKHGILMVDFANKLQEEGHEVRSAIEHAAGIRLRPILMTTAAMVLGVLPLLVAQGPGAEARFSMGLVIAAGMAIGTLFTLFVVPAFYVLVAHRRTAIPAGAPASPTELAPAHHS